MRQVSQAACAAVLRFLEERGEPRLVDAGLDVAEGRQRRPGEAVAEVQAALVVDRQHAEPGAAGQRLARAFVQVGHQLVHVGEADVAACQRRVAVASPERLHAARTPRRARPRSG